MTLATPDRRLHQVDELITDWESFAAAMRDPSVFEWIGTDDVVQALLDRSVLQDELESSEWPGDVLQRVAEADAILRDKAPAILDNTSVALYRDDEPITHWWWRLPEFVLGERAEQLLSVPEAARLKAVHPHTVRAAIKSGVLPARRLARGFLIQRRDLARWGPARVGRPRTGRSTASDPLLDAFNDATLSRDFSRASSIAAALRQKPDSARRTLAVSIDALNRGAVDESLQWLNRTNDDLLPDGSRETATLVRAIVLLKRGDSNAAVKLLDRKSNGPGLGWRGLTALSEAFLAIADLDRARDAADSALQAAPGEAGPKYVAARVAWRMNRPSEALELVAAYRAIEPDEPDGLVLHGVLLGFLGDQERDLELHRRSAELLGRAVEDRPDALARYGVVLARLGDWEGALRTAARAQEFGNPDFDHAISAALEWAVAQRDRRTLPRVIAEAIRQLGASQTISRYAAIVQTRRRDVTQTLATLEDLRDQYGAGSEELAPLKAWAYYMADQTDQVRKVLRGMVNDAHNPRHLAYVAWLGHRVNADTLAAKATWQLYREMHRLPIRYRFDPAPAGESTDEGCVARTFLEHESGVTVETVWAGQGRRVSSVATRSATAEA